ncbi:HAD-IIB family hydrolase [Halomonas saccharevitans]|uniref:HAD-IIB family hydrolase n=1 Tax=Halomonas saccharevitans TaxID=416872 RepID=A0A1I6ZCQ2_9GAMM|nr:HAD-IIB family hydrolase [Halomonas saccharevitans]MDT8879719.1 HAD-IIB family hydrolase [Halomonas saccharevitans]SFT60473.1 mannosyl-3-phosphoglycerate phosphatase [Halomonas saccharevitans]
MTLSAASPPACPPRLVFTDLDGSLLDHHSYDWGPARPWLGRLKAEGVPVIPVTSKTRSEILPLRRELGLEDAPFIAENGALAGLPLAWSHARLDRGPGPDGLAIRTLGVDIGLIRQRLAVWRERLGLGFTTMSEMTLEALVAFTGLAEPQARLARLREGSEPLIWEDSDERLAAFREGLEGDGLRLVRGGRFWHVTGDCHKGSAVAWLIERFAALRGSRPRTLALGDGPNDIAMLEAVDQAVVIRGCHDLAITPDQASLYRSDATGPAGWAEGMDYWRGEPAADGARSGRASRRSSLHRHAG